MTMNASNRTRYFVASKTSHRLELQFGSARMRPERARIIQWHSQSLATSRQQQMLPHGRAGVFSAFCPRVHRQHASFAIAKRMPVTTDIWTGTFRGRAHVLHTLTSVNRALASDGRV